MPGSARFARRLGGLFLLVAVQTSDARCARGLPLLTVVATFVAFDTERHFLLTGERIGQSDSTLFTNF